ncbi:hypothetical protein GCM10011375_25300 [Hymenobacter qilianensis]|uniref:Uncharacterized protein n=2 Tax=Hymenobacter qilianensis TaxID=1385715 RepID=A0A7H0GWE5_9BACT|nr:hypothetical protein [Hymenobacter qilianensis]QNP52611.1 hypothetical protein H9L05_02265 [Hymenobacter qilianensis]GGF69194.1 hypothetical protein GCM10011375_25300 [Hymenobacter qilianensis]
MELNELRQMWNRHATDEPTPLSAHSVARMVARKSDSVVTRLRRNAWWEVGSIVYVIIALPFGIDYFNNQFIKGYLLTFELLSVAFLYYYYRKFKLLRRMDHVDKDVRGHLQTLILGLRGLLTIYLRLSLWVTIAAIIATTSYRAYRLTLKYDGGELFWSIGLTVIIMFLTGTVLYWLMIKFTKWYLQKLYGQHLDRLEGYLHELQAE